MAQVPKYSLDQRREYAFYTVLVAPVQPLFWNLLRLPCHLRHSFWDLLRLPSHLLHPLWILHDTDDL